MFNDIIIDNFCNPEHQGEVVNPGIRLSLGNSVCGDKVDIDLVIDDQNIIKEAKFRAWGCTALLAMANLFCRVVEGKVMHEISAMPSNEIDKLLGALAPSQHHCIDMLHDLFRQLRDCK
ncbi:iron-sulfur cluster assembly scaffold protein [Brenneria rubrifaciens]|uniref:Iron-sulfur cluster assembly scaffold protein n=1 Tax=Brenneria rubrifaciens TaxID=55213 RepID=A0A4P8QN40_9GAMM|nr:iron-sulfur cluster assembly scaffold protein [Brenneria rubrifaciens]QCR08371.1 iron-sulfur cluster assembly scaffold protein [Brenneria rubrifaciens]